MYAKLFVALTHSSGRLSSNDSSFINARVDMFSNGD